MDEENLNPSGEDDHPLPWMNKRPRTASPPLSLLEPLQNNNQEPVLPSTSPQSKQKQNHLIQTIRLVSLTLKTSICVLSGKPNGPLLAVLLPSSGSRVGPSFYIFFSATNFPSIAH